MHQDLHDLDPDDPDGLLEEDIDTEDDDDEHICPACNGSGEGMYDGSSCYKCHGTGEEPGEKEYEP